MTRDARRLVGRLTVWGRRQGSAPGGWSFSLDVCLVEGPNWGKVEAALGPAVGYGWTTSEAVHRLADGLVEEGWPDDRDYARANRG